MLIRLVLLVLLIPQIVFGADWYCDYTNGNDTTGDGSSGTPYKTIQKCVDVATGGDTINIANTSAQVLSAAISWTSGWTADNTKYTIFQAWDNGGSITIQRPDEASARIAATIDGNNSTTFLFNSSSRPEKIVLKNLVLKGHDVASNEYMIWAGSGWSFEGCEFDMESRAGRYVFTSGAARLSYIGNYFHGAINPTGSGLIILWDDVFIGNWYEAQTNNSARIHLDFNGVVTECYGNLIKITGAGKAVSYNNYAKITGNTFIGSGAANQIAIDDDTSNAAYVLNNMFYDFDGASSKPLDISSNLLAVGYNAYYDCNSNTIPAANTIQNDLTANDITGSGDPFVDSANDNYCVTGSTAEDAAYPAGSLLDIGALECTASGGGGNTYIFAVD